MQKLLAFVIRTKDNSKNKVVWRGLVVTSLTYDTLTHLLLRDPEATQCPAAVSTLP